MSNISRYSNFISSQVKNSQNSSIARSNIQEASEMSEPKKEKKMKEAPPGSRHLGQTFSPPRLKGEEKKIVGETVTLTRQELADLIEAAITGYIANISEQETTTGWEATVKPAKKPEPKKEKSEPITAPMGYSKKPGLSDMNK